MVKHEPERHSLYATLVTQLVTQARRSTRAPIFGCRSDKAEQWSG